MTGSTESQNKKAQQKQLRLNIIIVFLDIIAVNAAYLIALYARFFGYSNLSGLFMERLSDWAHFAPYYTVICLVVFRMFGLYNGV